MSGENINRRLNIYINDREVVNSMRGITAEMRKVQNQMRNLNAGAEDYDEQLARLRDTYSRLQAQQARFRTDMSQNQGVLQRLRNSLGPIASGMLAAFSVTALVGVFTSKMRDAYKTVVEFDQKQATLAATMGKTRMQIAGLTLDAIKIGSTSEYSAAEVSGLQTELARLGKTAPEIKAMTKDVLSAATALETDLSSAAVLVGGQLNSFGENADKAGKYADIMANNVNISATSYDYLATSLPKVSAVAANNNVTFEKLNATMGVLADQNIQAETAGTGFRNILLESAKAGKPYQEMLDQVKNSSNQAKTAVELFGKENATVAVILANSTSKIEANTEALEHSAGSAEKLAKEKMNSIKGAVEGFSGAWEGFILSMEKGDGIIARSVRGMIEFGTSVLNLVTPMSRLSDSIKDEQLGLNMLVGKITSTNIKNEERKQLLIQLKNEYPDFIGNIDIETVSNAALNKELGKVNEQYIKRIALQEQAEKVEDAAKEQGEMMSMELKYREKLFKVLQETSLKYKLKIPIDYGDLEKSANQVQTKLRELHLGRGLFGERKEIEAMLNQVQTFERSAKSAAKAVDAETEVLNRQSDSFGINTEAQNEAIKADKEQVKVREELIKQATEMGMNSPRENTTAEIRRWIDAQKEKARYTDEMSEADKNKREKEIEDAKKHSEDLLKELADAERELLETKRKFQDLGLDLAAEGYDREKALLDVEFARKIEDLRARIKEEQDEIDNLNSDLKDPKNSKSDVAVLKQQINTKLEMQRVLNDTIYSLEKTHLVKIAQLQEVYIKKAFDKEQERAAREIQNLRTAQNFELAEINSFQKAKAFLSEFMSADELKKITTLEQARKAIKERHLKEQFEMEKANLDKLISQYQAFLELDMAAGFQLLSEEERNEMIAFLDQAKSKLAEITNGNIDKSAEGEGGEKQPQSGIDVLGYSPDQWESVFGNLDNFQNKLSAIQMVAGTLQQAFSTYFKFLEAGEQRALQKFQNSVDRKKRALADQLDKGWISQESYNARVAKLDQDLAKKKAELEYRQAKRERAMAIANVLVSTSLAIMQAYAQLGPIAGSVMAGVIGALGALQLATIIRQPLPSKTGFKDGGYTGDGPENQEAGPAHKGEYYIPKRVLFGGDPAMPNVLSYLEAKRKGQSGSTSAESLPTASGTQNARGNEDNGILLSALNRLSSILEKIEREGLVAKFADDMKASKKIKEQLKKYESLKSETRA